MTENVQEYLLREFAIKCWLEDILCVEDLSAFADEGEGSDLSVLLQNGVILCNLMLNLKTKSIPRVNLGKDLELGFKKKENINFFLQACEENHIPSAKLFRISDLTEPDKGQFMRVIECLEKLAEKADKEWEFYFKLSTVEQLKKRIEAGKVKVSFSEKDRARARGIIERWESKNAAKPVPPQRPRSPEGYVLPPSQATNNNSHNTTNTEGESSMEPPATTTGRRPSLSGPPRPAPPVPKQTSATLRPTPGKINIPSSITNPTPSHLPTRNTPNFLADVSGLKNRFEKTGPEPGPTPTPTTTSTQPPAASPITTNTPPPVSPRRVPPPVSPRNPGSFGGVATVHAPTPTPAPAPTTPPKSAPSSEEVVLRGVIKLQALYRGWKARREYRNRVRNVAYRQNVAAEIFKTEEDYVASLRILFKAYLDPIKEQMDDNKWKSGPKGEEVELKTFKGLYSDLQVIMNYNAKLLSDIEPLVQNWSPFQKLGHIFLQLSNFLKVYTQYVKDYEQARMEFTNAKKNSAAFRKFMQDCEEKHKDTLESQDMSAFLIRPVQRIPRYLLLLKDLTKHTDTDHADYESLQKALAAIENVAVYIEQKAEESDNVHMVTSIQSRFVNKADSLVSAGRKFVRQGDLQVLTPKGKTKQERTMFLFNDILVEAKKSKNKLDSKFGLMSRKRSHTVAVTTNGGKDLRFKKVYHLKNLRPVDMPDDDKNANWFVLENAGLGEVVLRLFAADKLTKTEWIIDLRMLRDKMDKDQKQREVFMSSLKGPGRYERSASLQTMEAPGNMAYGPKTGDAPLDGPPVLPPKRNSQQRKANPFGPETPSPLSSSAPASSMGNGNKVLEKSHSYQSLLNSTNEPESRSVAKKLRAGSFSKGSTTPPKSSTDQVIQENAEKAEKAPTNTKKKRLAMLASFNK